MKRALVLFLLLPAPPVFASRPRLRLERIAPAEDGKTRVYASIVELEGQVDYQRSAAQFTLIVDGKPFGAAEKSGPFLAASEPLDLVLILETSALYQGKPLDQVKDAARALLEALPPRSRVLVIDYGSEVTPHPPFRSAAAAAEPLDDLVADAESGDLSLVSALSAALRELQKPADDGLKSRARRLIVVLSDGLDSQMQRKTFRALGDTAARAQVPIHAVAYSPSDERGPLLNLGELSKRSGGTFRWARRADDLAAQIETLAEEVSNPYVLTFALSAATLAHKRLTLRAGDLESNPLVFDGDEPPGGGALARGLLLGTLGLGLLAAGLAARKRSR